MIDILKNAEFKHVWVLYFLAIPVVLAIFYAWRHRTYFPNIRISNDQGFDTTRHALRGYLRMALPFLRVFALAFLIVALARPQFFETKNETLTRGIDIVLALDVSASMLANDFKPSRLEAAKTVAADFIDNRQNDRIGLVIFAGESVTESLCTSDHPELKTNLAAIEEGILNPGTAIGMGLATAVNRLIESTAKSKVIILLTDGVHNAGSIHPEDALKIAMEKDIKIYTIGAGSNSGTRSYLPKYGGYIENELDEELLQRMADETGGQYFRAKDEDGLHQVYAEIDELEKSEIKEMRFQFPIEKYFPFALVGLIILLVEATLRYTLLRTITG